ncbi:MAG: PDDEXK nuclease domain-containing protein, partial [Chlamydiia bacterium]
EQIVQKQEIEGWGAGIINRLSKDLLSEFPGISGFSRTNLGRMKAWYKAYAISPQVVGKLEGIPLFSIPWGHNIILIERLKDNDQRLWYAHRCLECGWSRNVLEMQIESGLYTRQGKALTNFQRTLPPSHSDLAQQTLKDPYAFDFLSMEDQALERQIEDGMTAQIQKVLLEFGSGFTFVGRQYPIEVSGETYFIDLLFYHLQLGCFIVVELKGGKFLPEHAGKMNFYLAAINDTLKHPGHAPAVGMILCKTKDKLTVEYALSGSTMPIGVASYITKSMDELPRDMQRKLPTVEELEMELGIVNEEILVE